MESKSSKTLVHTSRVENPHEDAGAKGTAILSGEHSRQGWQKSPFTRED